MIRRFLTLKALNIVATKTNKEYLPKPIEKLDSPQRDFQLSKIKNGLVICSLENNSPLSSIGIIVKAGTRYENFDKENLGITHMMKVASSLATLKCSQFGLSRNLDHIGSSLMVSTTRDFFMYILQTKRDNIDTALKYLSYMATMPAFKHWEVKDSIYKLSYDIHMVAHDPEIALVEDLHKAIYRNGLQNSLFSPKFMIGKHTCGKLREFHESHFTAPNMALIGVGMDHSSLANRAYKNFSHLSTDHPTSHTKNAEEINNEKTRDDNLNKIVRNSQINNRIFYSNESRVHTMSPLTYALLVSEGSSHNNSKDMLSLALLQKIMGLGPHTKYGTLQTSGKMTKHCLNYKMNPILSPFSMTCYNVNYSDTGLFGVYIISQPEYMDRLLRCSVDCFREIGKTGVEKKELEMAKKMLKSSYLMSLEDPTIFIEDAMLQASLTHQVSNSDKILGMIDTIEVVDISKVAKKLINKCALAVRGNLKNTPYLDQLMI
ncbi:unnamed protein product [Gordionus sp. m RMFG-2023]|uniref:cytochrome b-c1 complex subunit 2, mitochondrial-like n=1 Tax=Gordionus sp. m RMFG-2023 TaxID=3053472 RepID=UPI0030E1AA17